MGHRIAKHVGTTNTANTNPATNFILESSTYYVLDASGNTMSVYERTVNGIAASIKYEQAEKHIYGSSRLGVMNVAVNLLGTAGTATYSQTNWTHRIGQRTYELSNHLGNVLSVISDKVIPHVTGSTISYYKSDILQSQDYSPFGVTLKGRNFKKTGLSDKFRFGFNGMEADDEIKGEGNSYDFGARMLDSRLGRFLSLDNYQSSFSELTPYSFAANTPILLTDENGDYSVAAHYALTYHAMMYAGFSEEIAKKVAHYASVYADHPDWTLYGGEMLRYNRQLMEASGFDPNEMGYKKDIDYSKLKNSQKDGMISSVTVHGMRTYWENIKPKEAVTRALYGGEFINDKGNKVLIEGAYNVMTRLSKIPVEELTEDQLKELGVALHTIQDCQVHKGARWVKNHKETSENEDEHPDADCVGLKHYRRAARKSYQQLLKFEEKKPKSKSGISSAIRAVKKGAKQIEKASKKAEKELNREYKNKF